MTSHMAFANVFAQAGLLGSDGSSQFNAISSNSGGTWFTTQFFYSPEFYQSVVGSPSALETAIEVWMGAYLGIQSNIIGTHRECELLADLGPGLELYSQACAVLANFGGGSWADFVQAMLGAAATAYGDANFINRAADFTDRVDALGETDLLIQMTVSSASVTNSGRSLSYLSPDGESPGGSVYSVPLAAQYAVKANQTSYQYGVPPSSLPLSVQWSEAPIVMVIDDWSPYFSYPGTDGTALTNPLRRVKGSASMSPLFDGVTPTVVQMAAASSAAAGGLSGLSPATMVQTLSLLKYFTNSTARHVELDTLATILYANKLTDGLAMCNQWPNDCDSTADGVLLDGGYTDNNALAMNVGDYQQQNDADLTATLKIIVTEADEPGDLGSDLLFASYFSCNVNQNVAPGNFVWPAQPGNDGTEEDFIFASPNPMLSLQIFQESMSLSQLASLRMPIPGTNLTTVVVQATTVDNPAYGTVAGQRVDILYIETHVDIPTMIIGTNATETWTPALIEAAMDIASVGAPVLVQRLNAFLAM